MKYTAALLLLAAPFLAASPVAAGVKGKGTTKGTTTPSKGTGKTTSTSSNGKSWLGRSTGCTPATCKTCKRDELLQRDESYLFPRTAAPLEPAAKTEAGLNTWTKEVWAGVKTDLNINGGGAGETPTSQLVEWKSAGNQFATVAGLYGCASVVVVSTCGVFMSHHWGNPMADQVLADSKFMWDNEFTNPIQGLGKVTGISAADLAEAYLSQADVDALYPSSGWTSLKAANTKCFGAAKKPKAVVIVHDGVGAMAKHVEAGKKMAEIVKAMVPALSTVPVVQYANAASSEREASESTSDYHGKVIVSYDPATTAYQVWMAASKLTAPILKGP